MKKLSAKQRKLALAVLSNDENSTDEELIQYFKKAGIKEDEARALVSSRDILLSAPYAWDTEL